MANRVGQVHKLGKKGRKRPDVTNNITAVPASISFC